VSVGYDLVAPKPFSQVVISGSGRVSISASMGTSKLPARHLFLGSARDLIHFYG